MNSKVNTLVMIWIVKWKLCNAIPNKKVSERKYILLGYKRKTQEGR